LENNLSPRIIQILKRKKLRVKLRILLKVMGGKLILEENIIKFKDKYGIISKFL
jgi:hypothetical protein